MKEIDQHIKFIELRCRGLSFDRIAREINISKPTLIAWSRKHRFDIQNLRAIEMEALCESFITSSQERVARLGDQLKAIEAELAKRNVSELSTSQLFSLADALRRQIRRETGDMLFTSPLKEIPNEDRHDQVQDWKP